LKAAGSKVKDLSQSEIDRLEEVVPTVNIELISYNIYNPETGKHFNKSSKEIEEINKRFKNYEQQRDKLETPHQQTGVMSPAIRRPEQAGDIDQAYDSRPHSQHAEPFEPSYVFSFVAFIDYSFDTCSGYINPAILLPKQAAYYTRPDSQYSGPSEPSYVLSFLTVTDYSLLDSRSEYLVSPQPQTGVISPAIRWPEWAKEIDQTYYSDLDALSSGPFEPSYIFSFISFIDHSFDTSSDYLLSPRQQTRVIDPAILWPEQVACYKRQNVPYSGPSEQSYVLSFFAVIDYSFPDSRSEHLVSPQQQTGIISPAARWPEQAREIDQAYYSRPDSQYSEPCEPS
jgi:hypothetical protein